MVSYSGSIPLFLKVYCKNKSEMFIALQVLSKDGILWRGGETAWEYFPDSKDGTVFIGIENEDMGLKQRLTIAFSGCRETVRGLKSLSPKKLCEARGMNYERIKLLSQV